MSQVKFQRRHYEYIAAMLRTANAPEYIVQHFANHLSSTNYLFKKDKFIEAASVDKALDNRV